MCLETSSRTVLYLRTFWCSWTGSQVCFGPPGVKSKLQKLLVLVFVFANAKGSSCSMMKDLGDGLSSSLRSQIMGRVREDWGPVSFAFGIVVPRSRRRDLVLGPECLCPSRLRRAGRIRVVLAGLDFAIARC